MVIEVAEMVYRGFPMRSFVSCWIRFHVPRTSFVRRLRANGGNDSLFRARSWSLWDIKGFYPSELLPSWF
ncbi:unnamed protein product [Closterium sp. NIES-54]